MWFKNLQIFRFNKPFTLKPETLAEKLSKAPFKPCGKLDWATTGWVSPLGRHSEELVHATNGYRLITTRTEQKLLPSSAVREIVANRVQELEEREMRKLRKKEKDQLKDEVIHDLLPRAFVRSHFTSAYVDKAGEWLIVDAASSKKAEELCGTLRDCLSSLDIVPLRVAKGPASVMTHWVHDAKMPKGFTLDDSCELREPQKEGGVVRVRRLDLASDEIHTHLKAGKQVTQLALNWRDRLNFVLTDDLSVKRLRVTDVIQEQLNDIDNEDAAALFDASFSIMSLEIAELLPDLIRALGGEGKAK